MKDIYSPLEIDEEWDNYSPVDATATAPATTEAPAMTVPVTTTESGAQDMNLGTEDPARDAANAEIAQEQGSTVAAPSVEENINKWTANDGNTNTENSDKLEFGEMGSKLPAEKADSVDDAVNTAPVKIDVNPSAADTDMNSMNAEVDNNNNDIPKPVEISMGGSDNGESTYSAESNANDVPKPDAEELGSGTIAPLPIMPTAPAAENTNTPDSKEDMLSTEVDASSSKKSKPMGELLPFKPKGELLEKNPAYSMEDAGHTESNDYTETESVSALEQYKATKSEALADLQKKYDVLQKTLAEEESIAEAANNKVEATRTVLAEMQQTIESEKKSLAA